jgi:hypothetical protein
MEFFMTKLTLLLAITVLVVGCRSAGVYKIGRIGDVTYYEVKGKANVLRPAFTSFVEQKGCEAPEVKQTYAGNGILRDAVKATGYAGGQAAGAALLRPSHIDVSNQSELDSEVISPTKPEHPHKHPKYK